MARRRENRARAHPGFRPTYPTSPPEHITQPRPEADISGLCCQEACHLPGRVVFAAVFDSQESKHGTEYTGPRAAEPHLLVEAQRQSGTRLVVEGPAESGA